MGFKVIVNDTVKKVYPYRFQAIIYCFMKQYIYKGKGYYFLDPKVKIVENEVENGN